METKSFILVVGSMNKEEKKATNKAYRQENKEKIKAYQKAYRQEHKEEFKAYYKAYRQEHKEKLKAQQKAYNQEHKEKIRAQQKAYNQEHKEKIKAQHKAYQQEHKEKIKAQHKAYQQENKERRRSWEAKRRSAKLNRTPAFANLDNIKQIYYHCPENKVVDHEIPLQGNIVSGLHVETNLQYITPSENSAKSNSFVPREYI